MPIRIILADDHRLVREGLRALLANEKDMEVICEAADGRSAVQLAREHAPDIVVMDINMPDLNGIDAARQIQSLGGHTRVIGLSMRGDAASVTQMLEAGARGYVLKDAAFEDLAKAVRTVHAGEVYLCPAVAGLVVERALSGRPAPGPASSLTPREREVLQLIAEGQSTKQIAFRLHVSAKTVETHRAHLMQKLGADSVAELTKAALREGLTTLDH